MGSVFLFWACLASAAPQVDDSIMAWVARMGQPGTGQMAQPGTDTPLAMLSEAVSVDIPVDLYTDPVRTLSGDPLFLDLVDDEPYDLPMAINAEVARSMRYLLGRGRRSMTIWIGRSAHYRELIQSTLRENEAPEDLMYLAMIESGFSPRATSHASAAGVWQFMSPTAREYGLRVDWWIDERRDPVKATQAAAVYLKRLHRMFGDWHLAMAAYNGGMGRVQRAMRKTGAKDFWELVELDALPKETQGYVPMILAAAIISKHPERYGFTEIEWSEPYEAEDIRVDHAFGVDRLAKAAGIEVDEFVALNPHLRRDATPHDGIVVHVPADRGERFASAVDKIPENERYAFMRHKVRRGETVSGIAAKYGVSVSEIVKVNKLRSANRIQLGMELVIPGRGGAPTPSSGGGSGNKTMVYTVRGGDSLSVIAERHGVRVSELQKWNSLNGTRIFMGQELTIRGGSGGSTAPARSKTVYTVKNGDTLSEIAEAHGVKMSEVMRWNGIRDASSLAIGQKLTIQAASSSRTDWRSHTVRSGESLYLIASRYGVSVSDLKQWNRLGDNTIHPGQSLRIRQ